MKMRMRMGIRVVIKIRMTIRMRMRMKMGMEMLSAARIAGCSALRLSALVARTCGADLFGREL